MAARGVQGLQGLQRWKQKTRKGVSKSQAQREEDASLRLGGGNAVAAIGTAMVVSNCIVPSSVLLFVRSFPRQSADEGLCAWTCTPPPLCRRGCSFAKTDVASVGSEALRPLHHSLHAGDVLLTLSALLHCGGKEKNRAT